MKQNVQNKLRVAPLPRDKRMTKRNRDMEKWKYEKLDEADVNKDGKLATQWAKEGYVVKRRRKGHLRWTNWWFKEKLLYFDADDVKKDPEVAAAFLKKVSRQKRLAAKKKKNESVAGWRRAFRHIRRILFLKVETSGRDSVDHDILAISWQLVDATKDFKVIEAKTVYFDSVPGRIDREAIEVNGLTADRLAELGTTSRPEGADAFVKAWNHAGLVVAHNLEFHMKFINKLCHNVQLTKTNGYCTMVDSHIFRGTPTMVDLALKLNVSWDGNIHHDAALYVEVLKQSFYALSMKGRQTCPMWF